MLQTQHSSCSSNGKDDFFEDNEIGFEEDCLIKLRDQRKKVFIIEIFRFKRLLIYIKEQKTNLKKKRRKLRKWNFK